MIELIESPAEGWPYCIKVKFKVFNEIMTWLETQDIEYWSTISIIFFKDISAVMHVKLLWSD